MTPAMGSDLVAVDIMTHTDAHYTFPDMPLSTLENVVKLSNWQKNGVLILVNVSGAVLSLPARVVKTISWNGVEQHAAVHQL